MATRDVFASHVERFDLNVIFESDKLNRADIGKAVSDKGYGLFKPYETALDTDGGWIAARWNGSQARGFTWACNNAAATFINVKSPLDLDPMQVSLSQECLNRSGRIREALVTLYSGRPSDTSGWNFSRQGDGIKSILGQSNWEEVKKNSGQYLKTFNEALAAIAQFSPDKSSADAFRQDLLKTNNWSDSGDLSVPFHIVWPQYYPVWYGGGNQPHKHAVRGIDRLLDQRRHRQSTSEGNSVGAKITGYSTDLSAY